ncbi:hypothetical protein F5884DRAFT_826537 [Xylogone sp. PMI_703]|nr:hypothetical protein F5884DRAFT_826537 [Xylogone sp. PMI_703]
MAEKYNPPSGPPPSYGESSAKPATAELPTPISSPPPAHLQSPPPQQSTPVVDGRDVQPYYQQNGFPPQQQQQGYFAPGPQPIYQQQGPGPYGYGPGPGGPPQGYYAQQPGYGPGYGPPPPGGYYQQQRSSSDDCCTILLTVFAWMVDWTGPGWIEGSYEQSAASSGYYLGRRNDIMWITEQHILRWTLPRGGKRRYNLEGDRCENISF